jgi:hypothetical protein
MSNSYSLDEYVRDVRTVTAEETDPINITDRVAPLAKKFAQTPGWIRPEYRECDAEQGFGVHLLHEEPNHDVAVFVFSWLPNRGTPPHNHKTWGVVVGIEGQEQEINYDRRDDATRPGYADLRPRGRAGDDSWRRCALLPRTNSQCAERRKGHFDVAAHLWPSYQLHWPLGVRSREQAREAVRDQNSLR